LLLLQENKTTFTFENRNARKSQIYKTNKIHDNKAVFVQQPAAGKKLPVQKSVFFLFVFFTQKSDSTSTVVWEADI
jgi:hypothetical protein